MSNECRRCGTETEAPFITTTGGLRFDGWLCDHCRQSFREWLEASEKPPVRGGCSSCAGPVEATFRYVGHGVEVVVHCPRCDWTERVDE
ncbi:hypothetical protein K745_gp33 [Haloarcula hispanica virus PH1]|uniref:Uncharacterized protein n=1 Tax=Haloarcula hispanica virus PH1 TaxID=1282967 RepID=M4JFB1_9VIRU|nr:hypothetical protein K745_gp33 [Haloarcula hispanica virus PH1]AGC65558.1 hypothetical protein HhPH1_gp33 [Haloarcula hispanica virus PH1]